MTPQDPQDSPDPQDDATLMRHVDGELTPGQAAAVDAAAASDPALAARLQALRALRAAARQAFPAVADPRDQALAALIAGSAPTRAAGAGAPSPLSGLAARLREAFAPRLAPLWAGAAAAAFVLGLMVGNLGGLSSPARPGSGLILAEHARIADPALVRVLDRGLAADGPDARGRAVGLTFRAADGAWCRTFTDGRAEIAGLACRQDGAWTAQALAPFQPPPGEVRTAAAETPPPVLAAVDALIQGDTLDAPAETRARDAGWR